MAIEQQHIELPDTSSYVYKVVEVPVLPADSAFKGSKSLLSELPPVEIDNEPVGVRDSVFLSSLVVIFTLIFVLMMKKFIRVFPSIIGCFIRLRETFNLEDSMKLKRDRDYLMVLSIIPFCILTVSLDIWQFHIENINTPDLKFLMVVCIAAIYILVRYVLTLVAVPSNMDKKMRQVMHGQSYTFFIALTFCMLVLALIKSFLPVDAVFMRMMVLYVILLIYVVYLVRKMQLLSRSCHILTSFLYLCALEILPTGLLIAAALLL